MNLYSNSDITHIEKPKCMVLIVHCYLSLLVQAVERQKKSSGNMPQEEINNKAKWVKLTGHAAEPLLEAFLEPEVVVQCETMQGGVEDVTAGSNNTPIKEDCLRAGQGIEEDPQVTEKNITAEVKPVSGKSCSLSKQLKFYI